MSSLLEAIKVSDPDEIYNLAAASYVSTAFEQPVGNAEITGLAVTKMLEAIRFFNQEIRFYQASSSEMYGNNKIPIQDEETPFVPASPYGISKLYAHWITNIYRQSYGMFAVTGILFNHESPLRGLEFVSRKITNGVAEIYLGLKNELVLGNLDSKRDWGYAPEYVEAMRLMLQNAKPETFVISTGESHTVREFARLAFELVGLDWKKHVRTDKRFFRPLDVENLCGNDAKAKRFLSWAPKIKFETLVKIMLDDDIRRWKMFLDGKSFPWDAPLYPSESNIITRLSRENRQSSKLRNHQKRSRGLDHKYKSNQV